MTQPNQSNHKEVKKLLQSCIDSEIKSIAMGYIQHLDWLEKMSKQYDQTKCDRCGKFHIFKRKKEAL